MTNQNESRYFQLVDQFLQSESKASVLNQAHSFSENLSDDALLPEEFVDIHRKYVQ
ncbi:phosphatase RsbU N-terminal domain-containing protein, partial [Staphylococcus pseudintermedius]